MKRTLATMICTVAWVVGPAAQQQTALLQQQPVVTVQPVPPVQTFAQDQDAERLREEFRQLMEQYPPSVRRVIALDPSLLNNPTYMASYSQLAAFIAQHPEVGRNPAYFFGTGDFNDFQDPQRQALNMWSDVLTGGMVFVVLSSVAAFIAWLLKTFMDHRRWLHVSKVQTEAHNKLLDRLTGHEELLAYIQTPSGRRFLEAAPVLEAEPRAASAPISRVIWSAQIGVVLVFAGVGLHMASTGLDEYVSAPLSLIGTLAVAVGIGFVASAAAAYLLSRRLGLVETRTNG